MNQEDYHEASVTERNLVVFLQAVENIFLENMICNYPMANKSPRTHGFIVADIFYVETEADVKKIHLSF